MDHFWIKRMKLTTRYSLHRMAALCMLAIAPATSVFATEQTHPLWIGSYTATGSEGIHVYRFDSQTGMLSERPEQAVKTHNPSWLTFSPNRRYLYAVNENGPGQTDIVGRVTAFRVDPASGTLQQIGQVQTLGSEPAHATVSSDSRYLFVSNYSVNADPGGTLAVIPLDSEGRPHPVVQIKTHHASRTDLERQASPHMHSVVESPDGHYVLGQDLGADRIYIYRYDSNHPEHPLTASAKQPFVQLPPGSGPRHLIFSANAKQAYLTLEMTGQVAVLDYADGQFALKQIVELAAEGFTGKNGAGALHVSPDGRFLYVTNRGTDNQMVVFAIDPNNGQLALVSRHPVGGQEPREFTFDPSGRFVLIANQRSNAVVVMERDLASGQLGRTIQTLSISTPADLKFTNSN